MNKNKDIVVSEAMISAGLKILRESGALACELSSDRLLVQEILDSAIRFGKSGSKNSEKNRQAI